MQSFLIGLRMVGLSLPGCRCIVGWVLSQQRTCLFPAGTRPSLRWDTPKRREGLPGANGSDSGEIARPNGENHARGQQRWAFSRNWTRPGSKLLHFIEKGVPSDAAATAIAEWHQAVKQDNDTLADAFAAGRLSFRAITYEKNFEPFKVYEEKEAKDPDKEKHDHVRMMNMINKTIDREITQQGTSRLSGAFERTPLPSTRAATAPKPKILVNSGGAGILKRLVPDNVRLQRFAGCHPFHQQPDPVQQVPPRLA